MLDGIVPILPTPFNSDGELDLSGLGRVVEFVIKGGASGLASLGLASEAFALTPKERDFVIRTIRMAAGPGVHVIAGIDATSVTIARAQATAALDAGADGLMVLPPYLVKPSRNGLVDFYGALGEEFGGVMVQDAPNVTGVEMDVELILELSTLPGVDSFKIEAPDSYVKMRRIRDASAGPILMGGRNAVAMLDELAAGATGTMPACEFTRTLAAIHADVRAGRPADKRLRRLQPLLDFGIIPRKGWAVHKYVLRRGGVIESDYIRAPAETLTETEIAELECLLKEWEMLGEERIWDV